MKALIIEDDKDLASLLKTSLKQEFFTVDICHDGEKGLFYFRTNHYDLLLVDYHLPLLNGKDLIKAVRSENKNVKIIILTVEFNQKTKEEFFSLEIDDYITKPFVFSELIARVKALMRRPTLSRKDVYKIDDLTVDIEKHSVTRGKKNIYLSFKEMMLLELFLKNKGKLMSRNYIMENIWDINADPFSNTIESHILKLRRKLDPQKNLKELIHTIKGRGYKMSTKKW